MEWGTKWTMDRVSQDEFIKILYEKALSVEDFPYWKEVFIERRMM